MIRDRVAFVVERALFGGSDVLDSIAEGVYAVSDPVRDIARRLRLRRLRRLDLWNHIADRYGATVADNAMVANEDMSKWIAQQEEA